MQLLSIQTQVFYIQLCVSFQFGNLLLGKCFDLFYFTLFVRFTHRNVVVIEYIGKGE